ncbi:17-beta-hydroxysteroid dehydrogenase 13-like [Topomyia yanbarensis]|uniref:17-beta-hydroxysteroid dehydrogenase 13-like n=1 Tax=Topomyia yanbarensis TaxID=2498891 RepID=UPI00273AFB50|nr:17-beta-hydroxysteroid dehydrogenase 13-like [Topomyia yanbarensis]
MSTRMEQYFRSEDGSYVAAAEQNSSKSFNTKRLEKLVKIILLDIVPKTIKLLLFTVLAFLKYLLVSFLPAQRKSIAGQVALVTGGANGLGKALCFRLAQEGCAVAVADIDLPSAQETAEEVRARFAGVKVEAFHVDVGDYKSVVQLRKNVERVLGPVDVLVNNAGLLAMLSLSEGTPEDVQRIVSVNLMSHFWTIREFKAGMVERRRGHIVAVCSVLGVIPFGRTICYNTTKFALRGMMTSLNEEFFLNGLSKDLHITIAYPAGIRTRKQFVDFLQELRLKIPWHTPEYVANAIIDGVLTNQTEVIPSHFYVKWIIKYFSILPTSFTRLVSDIWIGKVPQLTE